MRADGNGVCDDNSDGVCDRNGDDGDGVYDGNGGDGCQVQYRAITTRYNMEPDGERISESLHGACPTALGIK